MPRCVIGLCLFLLSFAVQAANSDPGIEPPTSDEDAFNISRGNTIIRHSPVIDGFYVADMFGERGGAEPGNTIFSETRPPGDMDYVEFSTEKHIRLKGFRFIAASGLFLRPTDRIIFYVDTEGNGNYRSLSTNTIQQVNPGTTQNQIIGQTADVTQNLDPVVARNFRIEIFRPVWSVAFPGPRVVELDAITEPNSSLPVTVLKLPSNETEFKSGVPMKLQAESTDPDGIRRVNFYANGVFIGSSAATPYELTWENPEAGEKILSARGVDFLDDEGMDSNEIVVVIKETPVELKATRYEKGFFRFEAHQLRTGIEYSIKVSDDLVQWNLLRTFFSDNSMMIIEDEAPTRRFYKIVPTF